MGKKSQKAPKTQIEQVASHVQSLFNVTDYDCLLAVAIIGIMSRMFMLVAYPIFSIWIEFDSDIGFWGYAVKIFWIYFDVSFIRIWRENVRPRIIGERVDAVKQRVVTIARAITLVVTGVTLRSVIIYGKLHLFFAVNRLLVMGSLWLLVILTVYRMVRLSYSIENDTVSVDLDDCMEDTQ